MKVQRKMSFGASLSVTKELSQETESLPETVQSQPRAREPEPCLPGVS
jgi:hypothetical protein